MKPTVYLETSVIGHLTSRLPRDLLVAAQMVETRRWWDESRHDFALVISWLVEEEISRGDPTAAADRLAMVRDITLLEQADSSLQLADNFVLGHALPHKARADALHLAICAVNGVNYLLTWNCRHLANATRRERIGEICRESGYNPAVVCTPIDLKEMPR